MSGLWVIGYGSLIYKPPPYTSFRVSGYLKGFIRRFWQSSSDHRGTPESPGRVVTLIPLQDLKDNDKFHNSLHLYELGGRESGLGDVTPRDIQDIAHKVNELDEDDLRVWGVAYYIEPENVPKVKEYLDVREQDGYSTHRVPFHIVEFEDDHEILQLVPKNEAGDSYIESMIYIGTIDNESFIGPESIDETAGVISKSRGPSGPNIEYLVNLNNAIRQLDNNRARDYYLEDLVGLATAS